MKYFVLAIFLIVGCNTKEKIIPYKTGVIKLLYEEDIPPPKMLLGKKLELPVLLPNLVLALQDYLVVSERGGDTILHVFDKRDYTYLHSVGIDGFGPGEIISPGSLWPDWKDPSSFWVEQRSNKMLSKFDASNPQAVLSSEYFKRTGDMYQAINLVWSSDSTWLGTRADGNEKFVEYDKRGTIINSYDTWDHMGKEGMPTNTIIQLNQGRLMSSLDKTKFVLACLDKDIIEILDKKSGKVLSIRGPIHHSPDYDIDYSAGYPMLALKFPTVRYCYVGLYVGEDKIFGLFSGHTFEDVDIGKNTFCETIYVFNYDGELMDHFQIDKTVREFTVDESQKKIYGITFDEDPNIVVFEY